MARVIEAEERSNDFGKGFVAVDAAKNRINTNPTTNSAGVTDYTNNNRYIAVDAARSRNNQATQTMAMPTVQQTQMSRGQMLSTIYDISKTDSNKGAELFNTYNLLTNTPGNPLYNQYARATNPAVQQLEALGYDLSGGVDKWMQDNAYLREYATYTNAGNISGSFNKKTTNEQKAAYYYYQLEKDVGATAQAEEELRALKADIAYLAGSDRSYTDKEIADRIDWKKYPTLQKMDDPNTHLSFNKGIDYSKDDIDLYIWQARNGGGSGNTDADRVMQYRGEGNQYAPNEGMRKLLDPSSPDYNPYMAGGTADDVLKHFGVYRIDADWFKDPANRQYMISDPEYWQEAVKIEQNAQAAEDEIAYLTTWLYGDGTKTNPGYLKKKNGKLDNLEKDFEDEYKAHCPTLQKMDESIDPLLPTGKMVDTGRPINWSGWRNFIASEVSTEEQEKNAPVAKAKKDVEETKKGFSVGEFALRWLVPGYSLYSLIRDKNSEEPAASEEPAKTEQPANTAPAATTAPTESKEQPASTNENAAPAAETSTGGNEQAESSAMGSSREEGAISFPESPADTGAPAAQGKPAMPEKAPAPWQDNPINFGEAEQAAAQDKVDNLTQASEAVYTYGTDAEKAAYDSFNVSPINGRVISESIRRGRFEGEEAAQQYDAQREYARSRMDDMYDGYLPAVRTAEQYGMDPSDTAACRAKYKEVEAGFRAEYGNDLPQYAQDTLDTMRGAILTLEKFNAMDGLYAGMKGKGDAFTARNALDYVRSCAVDPYTASVIAPGEDGTISTDELRAAADRNAFAKETYDAAMEMIEKNGYALDPDYQTALYVQGQRIEDEREMLTALGGNALFEEAEPSTYKSERSAYDRLLDIQHSKSINDGGTYSHVGVTFTLQDIGRALDVVKDVGSAQDVRDHDTAAGLVDKPDKFTDPKWRVAVEKLAKERGINIDWNSKDAYTTANNLLHGIVDNSINRDQLELLTMDDNPAVMAIAGEMLYEIGGPDAGPEWLQPIEYAAVKYAQGIIESETDIFNAIQLGLDNIKTGGATGDDLNKLVTMAAQSPEAAALFESIPPYSVTGNGQVVDPYVAKRIDDIAEQLGVSADSVKMFLMYSDKNRMNESLVAGTPEVSDFWRFVGNNGFYQAGRMTIGMLMGMGSSQGGGGILGQIFSGNGAGAGQALIQALKGGITTWYMAAGAAGAEYTELEAQYGSRWQNALVAINSGMIENFTESLFGFNDMASFEKLFGGNTGSIGRNVVNWFVRYIESSLEEGLEEVTSEVLNGLVGQLTDEDDGVKWFGEGGIFDGPKLLEVGEAGAFGGLFMGTAGTLVQAASIVTDAHDIQLATEAANYALETLQNKHPEVTITLSPLDASKATEEDVINFCKEVQKLNEELNLTEAQKEEAQQQRMQAAGDKLTNILDLYDGKKIPAAEAIQRINAINEMFPEDQRVDLTGVTDPNKAAEMIAMGPGGTNTVVNRAAVEQGREAAEEGPGIPETPVEEAKPETTEDSQERTGHIRRLTGVIDLGTPEINTDTRASAERNTAPAEQVSEQTEEAAQEEVPAATAETEEQQGAEETAPAEEEAQEQAPQENTGHIARFPDLLYKLEARKNGETVQQEEPKGADPDGTVAALARDDTAGDAGVVMANTEMEEDTATAGISAIDDATDGNATLVIARTLETTAPEAVQEAVVKLALSGRGSVVNDFLNAEPIELQAKADAMVRAAGEISNEAILPAVDEYLKARDTMEYFAQNGAAEAAKAEQAASDAERTSREAAKRAEQAEAKVEAAGENLEAATAEYTENTTKPNENRIVNAANELAAAQNGARELRNQADRSAGKAKEARANANRVQQAEMQKARTYSQTVSNERAQLREQADQTEKAQREARTQRSTGLSPMIGQFDNDIRNDSRNKKPRNPKNVKSPERILIEFGRGNDVPIDTNKRRYEDNKETTEGYTSYGSGVAHVLHSSNLSTAIHEVMHALDTDGKFSNSKEIEDLIANNIVLYNHLSKHYEGSEFNSEAAAQYAEAWLQDPRFVRETYGDALADKFEAFLKKKGVLKTWQQASKDYRDWLMLDDRQRVEQGLIDSSGQKREDVGENRKNKARKAMDYLFTQAFDAKLPLDRMESMLIAAGVPKRTADRSVSILAHAQEANTRNIVDECIQGDYIVDPYGNRVKLPNGEYAKSVGDIMKAIPQEQREAFSAYLMLRHNQDRYYVEKKMPDGTIRHVNKSFIDEDRFGNYARQQDMIDEYEQQYKQFKDTAQALYDTEKAFGQAYLVDTQIMSQERFDRLWKLYPHYVPTPVAFKESGGNGRRGSDATPRDEVGRVYAKSDRTRADPVDSIAQQIEQRVRNAKQIETLRAMVELYDAARLNDASIGIMEEIPKDTEYDKISKAQVEEIKNALTDLLDDNADAGNLLITNPDKVFAALDSALDSIGKMQWLVRKDTATGANVLNVPVGLDAKGNMEYRSFYVYDKAVLNALVAAPEHFPKFLSAMNKIKATMSMALTVANPLFAVSNTFGDIMTAVSTGYAANNMPQYLWQWARSMMSYIKNRGTDYMNSKGLTDLEAQDWYRDFQIFGNLGSRLKDALRDPGNMQEIRRAIYGKKTFGKQADRKAFGSNNILKKMLNAPIKTAEWLSEMSEASNRATQYKFAKKSLIDTSNEYAERLTRGQAARRGTVDFGQKGASEILRYVAAVIPFYNASIQGAYKTFSWMTNPMERMTKGKDQLIRSGITVAWRGAEHAAAVMAGGTIVNMILRSIAGYDKDDEERQEYQEAYDMLTPYEKTHYLNLYIGDGQFVRMRNTQDPVTAFLQTLGVMASEYITGAGEDPLGEFVDSAWQVVTDAKDAFVPTSTIFSPLIDADILSTEDNGETYFGNALKYAYPETQKQFQWLERITGIPANKFQYVTEQYTGLFGKISMSGLNALLRIAGGEDAKTAGEGVLETMRSLAADRYTVDSVMSNGLNAEYSKGRADIKEIAGMEDGDVANGRLRHDLDDYELKQAKKEAEKLNKDLNSINSKISKLYDKRTEYADINDTEMVRETQKEINSLRLEANEMIADYFTEWGYEGDRFRRVLNRFMIDPIYNDPNPKK